MKPTSLILTTVGCALRGANANFLKWSPEYEDKPWTPAEQTLGALVPAVQEAPKPTAAPRPRSPRELAKRSTDVCGYINGISSLAITCGTQQCAYNSASSVIGCCPTTGVCNLQTTCYDLTQSSLFSTDNSFTLWCGSTQYPHCIQYTFPDAAGYTLWDCAVARGTGTMFLSPTSSSTTSSTTSTTSSASSTTTIVVPTPTPSSSSTDVGAIVGGVVGGVAGIALIGLGIWFFMRRSNKKKAANGLHAAATPAPAAYQSPPGGGPGGYGAAAVAPAMANSWVPPQPPSTGYVHPKDQSASMIKSFDSAYNPSIAPLSSAGSPPPQSPNGHMMVHNSHPGALAGQENRSISQQAGAPLPTELPTDLPDGEVRELAG